jgi:hypothetical protein
MFLGGQLPRLFGVPVRIANPRESEEADFCLCANWEDCRSFPDDVKTACCICGRAIGHRPTAPTKPKKICIRCAVEEAKKEAAEEAEK